MKSKTQRPLFETRVNASIKSRTKIFKQRGRQYSDTWRTCNFLILAATAKELGYKIKPEHLRALATASFCDMKHERFRGGWKDDHIEDGNNYADFLLQEMRELKSKK